MYDQYGATDENATADQGGFGQGTAGFDPSEIFKIIFRSGGFGRNVEGFDIFGNSMDPFGNQPDADVAINLSLSFMEAAKGSPKSVTFKRYEHCDACAGKGVSKGSKIATCKTCNGSGQVCTE